MLVFPFRHAGFLTLFGGLLMVLALGCPSKGTAQGKEPAAGASKAAAAAASSAANRPAAVKPEPVEIRLEAGDLVRVSVLGRPELTTTTKVSEQGTVEVPLVGEIPVMGIALPAAAERVATAYREGDFFVDPEVQMVLAAPRAEPIRVEGEVLNPGRLPYAKNLSVKNALAQLGGISPQAAEVAVILRRGATGKEPTRLEADLTHPEFATGSQNVILQPGDLLQVPTAPRFSVEGAVRNPQSYALRRGMTVARAIEVAGGLSERGSAKRVEVLRRDGAGRTRESNAEMDDLIQANDVIKVKERLFR